MIDDIWLALQYWWVVLLKALGTSFGSNGGALKRVGLFVLLAVVTAAVTLFFQGRAEAKKHITITVLKSIIIAVAVWFLTFLYFFAIEPAKLEQQTITLQGAWPNKYNPCVMQNITIAPKKTFASSSESVVFCNRKFAAPLTISVQYDKNPDATSGLAFPAERTVSADMTLRDHTVFAKLDSPSILPYQIFIVTVHSNAAIPPIATSITINSINPDK